MYRVSQAKSLLDKYIAGLCFYRTAISIQKIDSKSSKSHLKSLPRISPKSYRHRLYLKPLLIAIFNFSHKRPTFAFTGESGYTLAFRRKMAHSGLHAETQGFTLVVAWRFISHLTFGQAKAGGSGCTPTACVRFLRRRGPAGLRNPVCNLAMLLFFALCAGIPTRAR